MDTSSEPVATPEPATPAAPQSGAPEPVAPAAAEPAGGVPRATGRRAAPRRRAADRSENRWTLVVPALLVVALVLLVVGLATSASVWLAASLVASVLAAVLLVVERLVQRRRQPEPASAPATEDIGQHAAAGVDPDPAPPIDLDAPAIDPDDPDAVWVVDGRPRYHVRDCATLASLTAEPVPRSQALEDGFVACSLCEPTA